MKKSSGGVFLTLAILAVLMIGCAPASTPTPVPATFTPEPTPTLFPSPTPLPGIEVLPLDSLGNSIPWLPMENSARPGSFFFLFNLSKPPFTNVLVRRAFAAAIDRGALATIAREYGVTTPRPATTFTPPETLGRDLYNAIGVSFHPSSARQLLAQAGFTDLGNFPSITLMTNPGPDGLHTRMSEEIIRMWKIYLGIDVSLEIVAGGYFDRVQADPAEIFWSGQAADYNDPDDFLLEIFRTGAQYNLNHFSNLEFDELVDRAAAAGDPAMRQELYIQAERILCETEAAVIPIYHTTFNIP